MWFSVTYKMYKLSVNDLYLSIFIITYTLILHFLNLAFEKKSKCEKFKILSHITIITDLLKLWSVFKSSTKLQFYINSQTWGISVILLNCHGLRNTYNFINISNSIVTCKQKNYPYTFFVLFEDAQWLLLLSLTVILLTDISPS